MLYCIVVTGKNIIMKIVAITNPVAGNHDREILREELFKRFASYDFEIQETLEPLHAVDLAKNAVRENADIIIAAGGDGTVIEVISGMIYSKAKLGIIPFGTGNMLASNLGISANVSKSIDTIIEGSSQKIDIGKINDRYFAFMAGCGFVSRIIEEVSMEKKRKFGFLAYFIEGFRHAFTEKYAVFKIRLDNSKTIKAKALTVLVANSGNVVGDFVSIAPNASFSDGLLDLIIISPKNYPDFVSILWEILTRKSLKKSGKILSYQAKEIEIKSKPCLLVQADGDIIGKTPVKIQALPASIEVFTPKLCSENLLSLAEDNFKRILEQTLCRVAIKR